MSLRLVAVIVISAVVAGCGGTPAGIASTSTDQLQLVVRTDPQPLRSGDHGSFVLEVTSAAEQPLDLLFTTSQRGDVALETSGVEVYRWAAQRVFAQQVRVVTIDPGARVEFPLDEFRLPVGPGSYEMLATLTSRPELQVVRVPLTVEVGATRATIEPSSEPSADPGAVGATDRPSIAPGDEPSSAPSVSAAES